MATARRLAGYAASSDPLFKLPHPFLTTYVVVKGETSNSYQLRQRDDESRSSEITKLPEALNNTSSLNFTEPEDLKSSERPHESDNTPWGRARRSPAVTVSWKASSPPSLARLWLVAYAIFTVRPGEEAFRLSLYGSGADKLAAQLKAVSLAIDHPKSKNPESGKTKELLVVRGAFWQGAASPFGARPVWVPEKHALVEDDVSEYPLAALDYQMTSEPGTALCWHPRRKTKPAPGSVIYSRYIPHLNETFSMVALDYQDPKHLDLFHTWQNDPRVSQGWNETGTLDQHREYLRKAHEDPHQMTILARFDDTFFAYFEVYWAKEDRLGAYYSAGDFDRGRHSLVGDVRYRGPHRVSAWWSSLMHYLYLDDPRTMHVVGEPKFSNSSVLMYDLIHGFGLDKFVDLPHKRAAFVRCSRERFFQLCPLDNNDKFMGGTGVGLVPKL
ncbi:acyl-CoA N-acyltransferase [Diplogelasinospora grovesii]|uniref:Acyl-CoA N-acyltransferase n=1 Tax=Diplogelasinospora grovesii TaxID=303347 RepID=A0AAN6N695_9PEZI|nr:acyl-CoA N-acyltransferase [Diplogelasinospora grovesii]